MVNFDVHEDCIHYRACERLFLRATQAGCYVNMECSEEGCPYYLTANTLLTINDKQLPLLWILGKPHMRQGYKIRFCRKRRGRFELLENRPFISRSHFDTKRRFNNLVLCPECGSVASLKEVICGTGNIKYMVECSEGHFSRLYSTKEKAISNWNKGRYISFNPKLKQEGGVTIWL